MFIVSLNYLCDIETVEKYVGIHRQFMAPYFSEGVFIAAGRKEPRTGGIILAQGISKSELQKVIKQDPFYQHNIAKYDVIEFIPSKTIEGFPAAKVL